MGLLKNVKKKLAYSQFIMKFKKEIIEADDYMLVQMQLAIHQEQEKRKKEYQKLRGNK